MEARFPGGWFICAISGYAWNYREEAKLRGISNVGSQNGEHSMSVCDPGRPDWVGHGVPGSWFPHTFGLFLLSSEGQEVAMGTASLLGVG